MPRLTLRFKLLFMAPALATVIAWPSPSTAQPSGGPPPALVILVRHADRASSADDSPLSAAGLTRAKDLAAALRDARVTAIITTKKVRSRATAQPLAAATGLNPIELEGDVEEVVKTVRSQAGGVLLVVGHSDTIPRIITALGGPTLPPNICAATFDHLFVLVPTSTTAHFARGRYGRPSPPPGPKCL
jgi:broad specificity phosphatase PhoE